VMAQGKPLVAFDPSRTVPAPSPAVAQEPPAPSEVGSIEELYLTGVHLEQYRHATRRPETYWQEGLRRDPGESRLNNALGLLRLRRGEFDEAVGHFECAINRLTRLNPNARDGESWYYLGIAHRYRGHRKDAYDAFYKATWTAAWRGPAYFALAECDAAEGNWTSALEHVQRSLRADADNLNARNLLALTLEALGRSDQAIEVSQDTLAIDALDIGARWQRGISPRNRQEALDLAFDLLRAGQKLASLKVLESARLDSHDGAAPMILFVVAWLQEQLDLPEANETRERAASVPLDYCFPSRLEEMLALQAAVDATPLNWAAHYLLGNLLYDKRRYEEAIDSWEAAARLNPSYAVAHRNLGIAWFNIRQNAARALESFDRALQANPRDARVLYERDQLWKRTGRASVDRMDELLRHPDLISQRDDLSIELASLYNQVNRPEDALRLLTERKFQPWEGGEGLALLQYVRTHLLLGRRALLARDPAAALAHFETALHVPDNLGEARHLLSNQSEVFYWLGEAFHHRNDPAKAGSWWRRATLEKGDFQEMAVREISDATFWSALAFRRLGLDSRADDLFQRIYDYSVTLENAEPKIDYFATSLPAMLLFEDDPARRNRVDALFLRAQAATGLGRAAKARLLLRQVLDLDSNHQGATDLLRDLSSCTATVVARI
ncbi:MAG TPA: tetratricopeptide repeat protein, partial [Acidobacteriaceae bacterium]|nr:tetratricopeptide repeat protein [Acidobacteriaceae bacterium]